MGPPAPLLISRVPDPSSDTDELGSSSTSNSRGDLRTRRESLAHFWSSRRQEIQSAPRIEEINCEVLDSTCSEWLGVVARFDKDYLQLILLPELIDIAGSIFLPGAVVIGHLTRPFIQIFSQSQTYLLYCPDKYASLVLTLYSMASVQPAGLEYRVWHPSPPSLSDPDESLLACKLDAHFTALSPHSKSWKHVLGRLKRSGRLELWPQGHQSTNSDSSKDLLYSLDLNKVSSFRVRRVDPSLVNSHWVIFITPDMGGPESVYLKFAGDDDFEDWMVSIQAFSMSPVYSDARHIPTNCARMVRRLTVNVSSCRASIGDFLNVYVDLSFDDWIWARTGLNTEEKTAAWDQVFTFCDINGASPLELSLRRTDGSRRPSELDSPLGKVVITGYDKTPAHHQEQWYSLESASTSKLGKTDAALYITTDYLELPVLDKSYYQRLQSQVLDLEKNVAGRLANKYPRSLSTICTIFSDIYRADSRQTEWILFLISNEIRLSRHNQTQAQNGTTEYQAHPEINGESKPIPKSPDLSSSNNTFLRGNTLLTRALEKYMRQHGQKVLQRTVGRFARKVVVSGAGTADSFELDPSRFNGTPEQIQANQVTIGHYLSYLWSLIQSEPLPPVFHVIFSHLKAEIEAHLGGGEERVHMALAAFVFLRFYCPAILNPRLFELTDSALTVNQRRMLTLIAKILQGFANQVNFGRKEPWLIPMNSFIEDHQGQLHRWYDMISHYGGGSATLERAAKEAPVSTFMGAELSNPYLVDVAGAYSRLAHFVTELAPQHSPTTKEADPLSTDSNGPELLDLFVEECHRVVKCTQEVLNNLKQPDSTSDSTDLSNLFFNDETLLYGQDSNLIQPAEMLEPEVVDDEERDASPTLSKPDTTLLNLEKRKIFRFLRRS